MIQSGLLHLGIFFIDLELAIVAIISITAAAFDIKFRRIPNWLIVLSLLSSLTYQTFSGYGYGFVFWLTGLSIGFLSFFPFYIIRVMGAGDVKLMAAVGSFIGSVAAFQTVLLTLLAGGMLALLVTLWKRNWKLVFGNISLMTTNMMVAAMTKQLPKTEAPVKSAGNMPYGVAIAAGTLLYICFFRP